MSLKTVVNVKELDSGLILAPERYDPRRRDIPVVGTVLRDQVQIVSDLIAPTKTPTDQRFIVLNTGDALEGRIILNRGAVESNEVGSSKKLLKTGDVIISRLRPYLRQVAYIDQQLIETICKGAMLICSTEFFVLRSRSQASIAFLVPYLLSDPIQDILTASQEGGHHPRFNQDTLERLRLPENLLNSRTELSAEVEKAIDAFRTGDLSFRRLVEHCNVISS